MLTPLLRRGLELGEKVICIADMHKAVLLDCLLKSVLNVEDCLASGQLEILTSNDSYVRGGVFDPYRTISFFKAATESALKEGYSALRVFGEMTWALQGSSISRLIEYEIKVNEFLQGGKFMGICQYDRRRFDPALLLDVLAVHPNIISKMVLHNNSIYKTSSEILLSFLEDNTM